LDEISTSQSIPIHKDSFIKQQTVPQQVSQQSLHQHLQTLQEISKREVELKQTQEVRTVPYSLHNFMLKLRLRAAEEKLRLEKAIKLEQEARASAEEAKTCFEKELETEQDARNIAESTRKVLEKELYL
jgi:hypothetical protein